MINFSDLTGLGRPYEEEDVIYIPNMAQNYSYIDSGLANNELLDIIADGRGKLVFVWKKCKIVYELYKRWNETKPNTEV